MCHLLLKHYFMFYKFSYFKVTQQQLWTISDKLVQFWTHLNQFEPVWTISDKSQQDSTNLENICIFFRMWILCQKLMWPQLTMVWPSPLNIPILGELTLIIGRGWPTPKCHSRKGYEIWFCQSCPTWTLFKISVMNFFWLLRYTLKHIFFSFKVIRKDELFNLWTFFDF